jgi:hypothetical protein
MESEDYHINHEHTEPSAQCCKNCETSFTGNFCPQCGQSVKSFEKPLRLFIIDFTGNLFAFDTRFWRSISAVVLKPGSMVSDYVTGKRIRYMPPFRMYVFVSFVFFLLLSYTTNKSLQKNKNNLLMYSNAIKPNASSSDTVEINVGLPIVSEKTETINQQSMQDSIDKVKVQSDDPGFRKRLKEITENPGLFVAKFLKYLSWSVFILMPLYGFFLWIFFRKTERYYVTHFLFAINQHTILFMLLILIMLLNIALPDKNVTIENFLMLLLPVYALIGARQLYKRRWNSVLLRMLSAILLYSIATLFGTAVVAYFAFLK